MKKKKEIIISLIMVVSSLIVSIFAFVPIGRNHDDLSSNWMSKVDDNTKIVNLSLPGSHDSGATHSIADVAGKCQDSSIYEQLKMGVRFFDLRLQLVNDEFKIVHSFVDQKLLFKDVISDLYNFIKENPSEFLLVSIKKEESSINSTLDFKDAIDLEINKYLDVIQKENKLPSLLKEARGKIYILSRFNGEIGIPAYYGWNDDCSFKMDDIYIQDNYNIQSIDEKKIDILNTIDYANNNDDLVINFTSCYLDPGFPPLYAGTTSLAINPWLIKQISSNNDELGIIVADFVSENLTKAIYMRNIK